AVTNQPAHQVWAEHEASCPAVGGAVRHMPELPPLPRLLPNIHACAHRLVRRPIAVTAAGGKRQPAMCGLRRRPGAPVQTTKLSGRSAPCAKRSAEKGERSSVGSLPTTSSARYSPTAGACWNPCPEKPVA